jgi:hypothetical protein
LLTDTKHYNHLANQATAAKRAEYDAWIHSYTPAQIHAANLARAQLRKRLPATKAGGARRYTAKLVDDRRIKRPSYPFTAFTKERHSSGDMKGIPVTEASKIIGSEWKALSASEKKVCALVFSPNFNTYTSAEIRRSVAGGHGKVEARECGCRLNDVFHDSSRMLPVSFVGRWMRKHVSLRVYRNLVLRACLFSSHTTCSALILPWCG